MPSFVYLISQPLGSGVSEPTILTEQTKKKDIKQFCSKNSYNCYLQCPWNVLVQLGIIISILKEVLLNYQFVARKVSDCQFLETKSPTDKLFAQLCSIEESLRVSNHSHIRKVM